MAELQQEPRHQPSSPNPSTSSMSLDSNSKPTDHSIPNSQPSTCPTSRSNSISSGQGQQKAQDTKEAPSSEPHPQSTREIKAPKSPRIPPRTSSRATAKTSKPSLEGNASSRNVSDATTVVESNNGSKQNSLRNSSKASAADWQIPDPKESKKASTQQPKNLENRVPEDGRPPWLSDFIADINKRHPLQEPVKRKVAEHDDVKEPVQNKKRRCRQDAEEEGIVEAPKEETKGSRIRATLKKAKATFKKAKNIVKVEEEETDVAVNGKPTKRWLSEGLYAGLPQDPKTILGGGDGKGKQKSRTYLPLPMYAGEKLLEEGRDFVMPFDIYNPLTERQPKPEEWHKQQKNSFFGDAATEWKKAKKLPASRCLCKPETGCGDNCQNRYMYYECDDSNCSIGAEHCTNRAFASLKQRLEKGNKYDIGIEVMKTSEKGFGVRACRTFEPNQIIVEYAGEIITQEECDKRVQGIYKDKECFYLMTFDQNMIIDATKGSMARFVNHSCEPNCRMVKWTVHGKPRMALFAGDKGIMTGDELTYDYNFDPFSQKKLQKCCCGTPSCRGFLGPRPAKDKAEALKQANLAKANLAKAKSASASSKSAKSGENGSTKSSGVSFPGLKRKAGTVFQPVGSKDSSSTAVDDDADDDADIKPLVSKKRRVAEPSSRRKTCSPSLQTEVKKEVKEEEEQQQEAPRPSGAAEESKPAVELPRAIGGGRKAVKKEKRRATVGGAAEGPEGLRQYRGWVWLGKDEPGVVLEKDRPSESVQKGGRSLRKSVR